MEPRKSKSKPAFILLNTGVVLCLVLAIATLWFGNTINPKSLDIIKPMGQIDATSLAEVKAHKSVYLWQSPLDMPVTQMNEDLSFVSSKGMNTIYLDISDYIDFYEQKDSPARVQKLDALHSSLQTFVGLATEKGLVVHALAGNKKWGFSDYAYIQTKFLDFINDYNSSVSENQKIKGMQFDVETYNDPDFNKNKKDALDQYLLSLRATVKYYMVKKYNFKLGYTVPYWFDNENNNIPLITYKKKSAPIIYHMFDTLNKISKSYVVIMDYRNTVDGTDGSVAHAQNEVTYASKYAKHVKIIIAQETTDVEPAKITFYNHMSEDFLNALLRINKTFQPYSVYDGIAVNDLGGMRAVSKKVSN
jgi:hypothetical protein